MVTTRNNKNKHIDWPRSCSLIAGKTVKGKINELNAINSVLGWIICGNYQNKNSNSSTLCKFFVLTKTSLSQFETRDHKTLFGKSEAKVQEYNYGLTNI